MSVHRKCCACCGPGDIVRPQPCIGSDAFREFNIELGINVTHWDTACTPYFNCQYIKEVLAEQASGIISFAFLGACWFFDGQEPIEQTNSDTEPLGFNLASGTPLNGEEYWMVEAVFTGQNSCADCFNEVDSSGNTINEKWAKFEMCACEENFESPIPGTEPTPIPKPDDDGGLPGHGCPPDEDYCVRAFENNPVYVPARYLPTLMVTDCCINDIGPCITPPGCDDPLAKCHYWKEPISYILSQPGRANCCLKSCNDENGPEIVSHIPCGIIPIGVPSCNCLNIWTPYHLHPFAGGEQDSHCDFSPIYFDRYKSKNYTPENTETGAMQRGCCACCCGPSCDNMSGNWDYCRAFEGLTTFEMVIEVSDESDGMYKPEKCYDPSWCGPWNDTFYPCQIGVQLITFKFDLYPEVADTEEPILNELLNVTDCIQLSFAGRNGIKADSLEDWSASTGNFIRSDGCGRLPLGDTNDYGYQTCYEAWSVFPGPDYPNARWHHSLFSTHGPTCCSECIAQWYPPSGDQCPEPMSNRCPWCHDGPWDGNDHWGQPCCADVLDFCEGQPMYITKACQRSPGGTYGYQESSYGCRWGHYDFCRDPATSQIVGIRIGFNFHSGFTRHAGILAPMSSYGRCCTESPSEPDPCHAKCGSTAGCGDHVFGGWGAGRLHTHCFLLPDDRTAGEGECVPIGYAASGEPHGEYGKDGPPDHAPEDGIHPEGLEHQYGFPQHVPPNQPQRTGGLLGEIGDKPGS